MNIKLILITTTLIFISLFQYNQDFAQDLSYNLVIKGYEYNVKTRTSKKHGWLALNQNIADDAGFVLGLTKPQNWIYMELGGTFLFKEKLDKYIDKKYNSKTVPNAIENKLYSKYYIYLRPILNKKNKIRDIIFFIERQRNIKNENYQINDFILTEKEFKKSKEFSHLKNGENIDDVIKDNNELKMLIYETSEKIYYVSFEFKIEKKINLGYGNISQTSMNKFHIKSISTPFLYDIKYENSKGTEIFFDDVKQEHDFVIRIAAKDTISQVTNKKLTLVYNLIGDILPTKYSNGELNIKLILTSENLIIDSKGNKKTNGVSSFIKEISLKPDDVVEIKFQPNWPSTTTKFDYDPTTLKSYYYNWEIKHQSIFLKLVKK